MNLSELSATDRDSCVGELRLLPAGLREINAVDSCRVETLNDPKHRVTAVLGGYDAANSLRAENLRRLVERCFQIPRVRTTLVSRTVTLRDDVRQYSVLTVTDQQAWPGKPGLCDQVFI